MPTEAEWERAARADGPYVFAGSNDAVAVGWLDANAGSVPHPTCERPVNGWGLCDMTGNISEWVQDTTYRTYGGAVTDPVATLDPERRTRRGGNFQGSDVHARAAKRFFSWSHYGFSGVGFRLVRTVP